MEFEIRADRKPQGPRKLAHERTEYLRLMDQGLSNREACKLVGIHERTGREWRNGRLPSPGHRPKQPARAPAPPSAGPSRYLTEDERIHIADRLRENAGPRQIARELGRSPSTISREARRNAHPESGAYRPHAAQRRADARRPRPKPSKIGSRPQLRDYIQARLGRKWSPEQISNTLRKDFPGQPEMHVTHETIYQALYVQGRGELRRELARSLRTGRARRVPRRNPGARQPRFATPMVMISDRPAEAADRAVPGHWEGDLIIGKDGNSAIGTLVERATRYTMLVHLPGDHTAETVRDALTATVTALPSHLARSLTWDQGCEMAAHGAFSVATGIPVYFCNPASPWQRGSNENTNGLLRQYFPKGTNLAAHSPGHLAAVAAELNSRPRKTLDWDTPAERFANLLAEGN
jgi:transposase, IS30 family